MLHYLKRLIKLPIKDTVIITLAAAGIFFVLSAVQMLNLRMLNAECGPASAVCVRENGGLGLYLLGDLVLITRVLTELGLILLAAQVITQVVSKK